MKPIAHIENDFNTKFGVPRQSGLVTGLEGRIVFEPEYRNPEALRGLEDFSYIWLLWDFSEAHRAVTDSAAPLVGKWSPTVRPPRLGGNRRMGVFATRSPFRPNPIGLSSVRIVRIELSTAQGPVIHVEGADLMDGTPILDIKPYLPFTDAHPDARAGFAETTLQQAPLEVVGADLLAHRLTPRQREVLQQILAGDPRPRYQDDPTRVYCIEYAGQEVRFRVQDNQVILLA